MFKKYDAYKDSGVEWLGEIPSDWDTLRFRDICDFGKGLNITKENLENAGIPCVNYGEVHSKYAFQVNPEINLLKCVSEKYLKSSPKALLRYGDFIFADTSEDIEGAGNFTYLSSHEMTFAGYHTVIVRPKNNINVRFLAYVFDSLSFRNQVRKVVKGVKVYSITKSILKDTKIWLPDVDHEYKISEFLDKKTSQIDQAIAIKEQQIALLNEHKKIVIQKAVTQGLYPNVPMRDSGVEWIGEIPEHWEIVPLTKYSTRVDYRGKTPEKVDEGRLLVTTRNIKKGVLDYQISREYIKESQYKDVMSRGLPQIGDILFTMEAPLGHSAIVDREDIAIAQRIIKFRLDPEILNSYFVNYYFQTDIFQKCVYSLGTGSTALGIKASKLGMLKLIAPTLDEQGKIVEFLKVEEKKFSSAFDLIQQQIEKLKEYKTTLINDAVTGKIKVA